MVHKYRLRYSLCTLFTLTVAVAFAVQFLPRSVSFEVAHKKIRNIVQSEVSETIKLDALTRFVKIGDDREQIRGRLGDSCDVDGHGPGFSTVRYYESGLILEFYPDGMLYGIGYLWTSPEGRTSQYRCLAMPESLNVAGHAASWIPM